MINGTRMIVLPQIEKMAEAYKNAHPFPHIQMSFNSKVLEEIEANWPNLDEIGYHYNNPLEMKVVSSLRNGIPEIALNLINTLNSPDFLKQLEQITGIPDLIADHSLEGGGLHETKNGGLLKIHSDFPYKGNLHRRVNLLLYLNSNWRATKGGHLELWDRTMQHCVKRILPKMGTLVIFNTDATSYHGHPDPVKCKPHQSRKSIALYYYTKDRPEEEKEEKRNSKWVARRKKGEVVNADKEAFNNQLEIIT